MKKYYFYLLLFSSISWSQNLVHNFEFNGNLNDTEPSGLVLTISNTTTNSFLTSPNAWTWRQPTSPGGGLVLKTNAIPNPASYSLGFRIEFDETGTSGSSGYKKILSFLGLNEDKGLYFHNGNLVLFPFTENNSIQYQPNTFYDFILTREFNNDLKVYIVEANGTVTQVYNVNDNTSSTIPLLNGGMREFHFFMNDVTATEHTPGGTVRGIRLWDAPLSPSEIAGALSSVTTGDANFITSNGATLNGEVNPQGTSSTFQFEYGTTTSYGNTINTTPPNGSGNAAIAVQATITGLVSGKYHFRLKSTNISGTTYGSDQVFNIVTPGGVSGTNLWLKANEGTSQSNSNLTGWIDQTGTNLFTVSGSPGYQSNAINFHPSVTFNNTDPITSTPTNRLDGNTNISYVDGFAVIKNTNNNSTLLGSINIGSNYGVGVFSTAGVNTSYVGNGVDNTYSWFTTTGLTNTYSLINMDVSPTETPFVSGRINGVVQSLSAKGNDYSSITFTPRIGGTNNGSIAYGWAHGIGEVAEIILYPSSL